MNRRGFLGLLGAALAAPALPSYATSDAGVVQFINKDIVLSRTLDLRGVKGYSLIGCNITTSPDFVGESMLIIDEESELLVDSCSLDLGGSGRAMYGVTYMASKMPAIALDTTTATCDNTREGEIE